MKAWVVLKARQRCGRCGVDLEAGSVALEYRLEKMRRTLVRCPLCAGEPIGALQQHESEVGAGPRLTPLHQMANDFKVKQSGSE